MCHSENISNKSVLISLTAHQKKGNHKSFASNQNIKGVANSLLFVMAMLLVITSCKNKNNEVKMVTKSFTEEVEIQQNFNITFNRDLIPDSMLNKWEKGELFRFTPSVEGKYQWVSTHEIMFSPVVPLSPCTDYKLEIDKNVLLLHAPKSWYFSSDVAYSFHTPYLNLQDAAFHWSVSENQLPELNLAVNFNYKLNPAEVLKRIKLTVAGKEVATRLASTELASSLHLLVDNSIAGEEDLAAKLEIAEGLPVPGSSFSTKSPLSFETIIPSKGKLEITSIECDHNGTEGLVTVNTTQEVVEESIKSAIEVEPNIDFIVSKTDMGFTISSKLFEVKNAYRITVKETLQGALGGKLKEPYTQQIVFGQLQPSIKFLSSKGIYIGEKGNRNLAMNIVSIPKVNVKIYKIYENNIIHFFRQGQQYGDRYISADEDGEEGNWYEYNYYNTEDYGDLIWEQQFETRKLQKQGNNNLMNLTFDDKIKDSKGIYVVQVSSVDQNWVQASKVVAVSDIGLIVKQSEKSVMVFANSIQDMSPLNDVKINLISNKNQVVKSIMTNSDGVAVFDKPENVSPGYNFQLITATIKNDYNYLHLNGTSEMMNSRFDVGGKYVSDKKYDAYLYGDRDIYRPGETMKIACIVRDLKWNKPGDMPVKLTVFLPNGRTLKTIRKVLNDQGAFETTVSLPTGIITGTFRITVTTADDVWLATENISVEEFMPDKISVKTKLSKEKINHGDSITASVTAMNLFGPPASNRNYTMEFSVYGDNFYSKTFSEYNFSLYNRNVNFSNTERSGTTDQNGQASELLVFNSAQYINMGILGGKVFTTVFDESGRPVNRENYFKLYTQKSFVGLKYGDTYIGLNQPKTFEIAAVNADDKPLNNVRCKVQVIKKEWETVLQKVGSRFQYNSQYHEKTVAQMELNINQRGQFSYTPVLSGEYEFRLYQPGSDKYVRQYFYAYGYGKTENSSFEVDNDGTVEIKADKENYKTGDVAHLLFKTPFAGKLIVTLEQDKVLKYYIISTDKKSAAIDVYLKDDHLPNVFISATLIRPADDGSNPLIVAHGYTNLKVDNPSNKIELKIDAPLLSRSKTRQIIKIKSTPYSPVTIAVVDEGILQLKNYQTPDPYSYFYESRALDVNSFDIYPNLFPEIMAQKNYTGGGGFDLAKRVNPMNAKRVQLVALWSGIIETDISGYAQFPIDIPQFNGDLRVMAVSYKDNKFGSAEAHIKVADPIVINTGLPRFTSPRDTVIMPVTISNTTKNNATANATVSVTGPFKIMSEVAQKVTIKANSEERVNFKIAAGQGVGVGKIIVTVSALNEKFSDETELSVRPPASLQKVSGNGDIVAGQPKVLEIGNNFIPSTVETHLIVARSPLIQFADNLDYLVRYPYGCVEQTTSAAFPQLYFGDLSKTILKKTNKDPNPNYNVQQAISKLQSMLMSNGALSYWPGSGDESWFGTVYAAHFLWEAKKAGFEVDKDVLNRMHNYMISKLRNRQTIVYRYNINLSREIVPKEIPYSMYVLALANKSQFSEMNFYKANDKLLSLDGKYLLAAAYSLSGNKLNYDQLLPKAFEGEISEAVTGGSFYSYIRDEAISLNALIDADPNNPQCGIMARHLSQQMKSKRYMNTQENVFALLALGKIARQYKGSNASATVQANGKVLGAVGEKELDIRLKGNDAKAINISTSGDGKIFYYYVTEGISATGTFKEEDNLMRIRKTFYNKSGQQIIKPEFKQNDLVVVKLSIVGLTKAQIENVVITDMLPAGFEIENPRLGAIPDCNWIKSYSTPDYQDIRDDRINLFTDVSSSVQDFYYMVRCVTKGTYVMGPVQADAMYNGEYHSYNGAGSVVIK